MTFQVFFLSLELLYPAWLFVPILHVILEFRNRNSKTASVFFPPSSLREIQKSLAHRHRRPDFSTILRLFAVLSAAIALARPVEIREYSRSVAGIDTVFCVDLSSSMRAVDPPQNIRRMDAARSAAMHYIEKRPQDRFALVSFAKYTDLVCPPTLDHEAVQDLLRRFVPVPFESQEDATGIGAALLKSAELLTRSRAATRVIVLVTDGRENVATQEQPEEIAPIHAAMFCASENIRIFVLALGAESLVSSETPHPLKPLVTATNGQLVSAVSSEELAQAMELIDKTLTSSFSTPKYSRHECYPLFVAASWLLVLLAFISERFLRESFPC